MLLACNTLVKFAKVKIDMLPDIVSKTSERLDEVERVVTLLGEMKDDFQFSVQNADKKGCEDAGYLEYDLYEIRYNMSIKMTQANRADEADQYFRDALMAENMWGYWDEDRYCGKVLEYATGRVIFSLDEMAEMEDDLAMENDGFFFSCLQAFLSKKRGSVQWKSSESYDDDEVELEDDEFCDNCGMSSSVLLHKYGKKLLRCTRCKIALYCNKDCQVEAWKRGHKRHCVSTSD